MGDSDRAVVVGASMAGLLAARVLADHFPRVIIVERDLLPDSATFRKGVPQSRHTHVLRSGRTSHTPEWLTREFARTLRAPILYDAIKRARPLGPIAAYRRTENQWRHYEDLRRWPEHFLGWATRRVRSTPSTGKV